VVAEPSRGARRRESAAQADATVTSRLQSLDFPHAQFARVARAATVGGALSRLRFTATSPELPLLLRQIRDSVKKRLQLKALSFF
jgi:hypothetical protein